MHQRHVTTLSVHRIMEIWAGADPATMVDSGAGSGFFYPVYELSQSCLTNGYCSQGDWDDKAVFNGVYR